MGYNEYTFFNHIKYGAQDFMARMADFFGPGILNPATDFALAYPSTPNMTLIVSGSGTAWSGGGRSYYDGVTPITLTFAAADPTNPRIDLIEVGPIANPNLTLGVNQDLAQIIVKTGTPAVSPVVPTADAGYISLYAVMVAANATALTAADVTDLRSGISLMFGVGAITGEVRTFAGVVAPSGWLDCDGSAVSRTTYIELFNIIGTTYGVGDGSTTFNLPDMRGRMPIGAGTGTGLTARTLGSQYGQEGLLLTDLPSHSHTISGTTGGTGDHSHDPANGGSFLVNSSSGVTAAYAGTGAATWGQINTAGSGAHTHTLPPTDATAAATTKPLPPALALTFIIKT